MCLVFVPGAARPVAKLDGSEQARSRESGKYPKAAERLAKDKEALLAFYDFPAEHWRTFAPPTRSNRVSRRFGIEPSAPRTRCRARRYSLIFKLAMCAEKSFRRLNGFEQLAEVIRGVKFVDGVRATTQKQKIAA